MHDTPVGPNLQRLAADVALRQSRPAERLPPDAQRLRDGPDTNLAPDQQMTRASAGMPRRMVRL